MVEEKKLNMGSALRTEEAEIFGSPPGRDRFWRYGPLIIWAALIFIGSSNLLSGSNTSMFLARPLQLLFPRASGATLQAIHLVLRKAGHFTEYAILALFAVRALRTSSRELLRTHWFWASFFLVIIYSLTDEFHQSFVPSRGASIYDCMIDTLGGLTALALLVLKTRHKARQDLQN
jgi:VanZ family protein